MQEKKTVIVIGGGILGCVVSHLLIISGLNVILITEPPTKKNINNNKSPIRVDKDLIPTGIGGGSNYWSGLSACLNEAEWSRAEKAGFLQGINYQKFMRLYSNASKFGFASPSLVSELSDDPKIKLFYKSDRLYDFLGLLKERKNLEVVIGNVKKIVETDKYINLDVEDQAGISQYYGSSLVLAAGGIGNFELVNLINNKLSEANIYGHPKSIVATLTINRRAEILKNFEYNKKNGVTYYYGFNNHLSPHYLQLFPSRWYESQSYILIRNLLLNVKGSSLYARRRYGVLIENIFQPNNFFKYLKMAILSAPSIFIALLYKSVGYKARVCKYKIMAHIFTSSGKISLSNGLLSIQQHINKFELEELKQLLDDFQNWLLSKNVGSKINVTLKEGHEFSDANHFMGTCTQFLDKESNGFMKGKLNNYKSIYCVGVSNLWFPHPLNPTLLAIAFAHETVDAIVLKNCSTKP
jgi:hypothetical protein